MDLSTGTTVEGYEILKLLGGGGQSSVYLAVDVRLHRKVAIKLISDTSMADETGRRRFLLEAQTLSSLSHPNIATVFHIGEHRDHPFIVMEYVEGLTLQDYMERRRPDGKECIRLIASVIEAISYAHQKGFIHRDLKPSNIMVASDGQIKLLDFGLARITREVERQRLESPTELTATGVVMGTIYYLSPEQALTSSSSEKSDLFSLGVIIYEMITGKRPFDRNSALTTLYAIVHAEPPPISSPDPMLESLIPVVMRLLEKDPEERYPSAASLLSVLRALEGGRSLEKTLSMSRTIRIDAGPEKRKRMLRLLPLLLFIVSVVALWIFLEKGGSEHKEYGKERTAILVLPIRSGPEAQERHLADVITSEIISSLSRTPGLRVLTIPSEFLSAEKNWSERIVRENAVGFTLKGDLVMNGNELRLTAQIIDQGDYRVVWTKVFNEKKGSIFAIPSDISSRMAYEAGVILKADQLKFPGEKAFDLYTKADMLLSSYDPVSLPQSIDMFRECAREAPDFRPVYEKLGQALMQYRNIGIDYDPGYLDEAYRIIRKGREIRGDSILLRTQEIWYHLYSYDFDWARELVSGMNEESLDPTGIKHLIWMAFYLGETGTAATLLDEAVRREPFDASVHLNRVVLNTMLGDQAKVEQAYEESREIFRSPMVDAIIEGWRNMSLTDFQGAFTVFSRINNRLNYRLMDLACAEALFCAGEYGMAASYLETWLGQNPFAMEGWWMLCLCHELNGDKKAHTAASQEAIKNAEELYRRFPNPFMQTIRVYFMLLTGREEKDEIRKFASEESGHDSMTRYLRFICRVRTGLETDLKTAPVPYNPTYWMNRFCQQELSLLRR